jgi:hypothetical protein
MLVVGRSPVRLSITHNFSSDHSAQRDDASAAEIASAATRAQRFSRIIAIRLL